MRWPWSKPAAPSTYHDLRAAFIEQIENEERRSPTMTREPHGPEIYQPGTLPPPGVPTPPSKNPAEAGTIPATPEERRARADALEAERLAWAGRRERLQGTLARARTEVADIRAQLAAAETRARTAEIALAEAEAAHAGAVAGHETFLRQTAPAYIDEVLVYLRDQAEALRRPGVLKMTERDGPRNPLTLHRPRLAFSNTESIERRLRALLAAMGEWDAYRITALGPAELRARFDALLAALPAIDESVAAPLEPLLTAAETRELAWRATEQEVR